MTENGIPEFHDDGFTPINNSESIPQVCFDLSNAFDTDNLDNYISGEASLSWVKMYKPRLV